MDKVLDCFLAIFDATDEDNSTNIGFGIILAHKFAVQAICDMFENRNTKVRRKVLRLLTAICMTSEKGYERVESALKSFGTDHGANSMYEEFVKGMYFETNLDFRLDALRFINAIIQRMPQYEERIEARRFLTELGFDKILNELENVVSQIKPSDVEREGTAGEGTAGTAGGREAGDDSEDDIDGNLSTGTVAIPSDEDNDIGDNEKRIIMLLRPQLNCYIELRDIDEKEATWNDIKLNDPKSLFEYLWNRCVKDSRLNQLTHILGALCTIPKDELSMYRLFLFF